MHEEQKKRQSFMLLKNVVYYTYQLHCFSSNKQTPPEDAFKIIILEVMAWLRERFRVLDVPAEIMTPEPQDYESYSLKDIKSFRLDSGYKLELSYLDEEKRWAIQLMEPDMGPNRGEEEQRRPPAPGRLFFTNIGLVMKENRVEIGINVQVSELENETIPCEVFRIGVVKRLLRNSKIELEQDRYRILETARELEDMASVAKLKNYIASSERDLPLVIFSQPARQEVSLNGRMNVGLEEKGDFLGCLSPGPDVERILTNLAQKKFDHTVINRLAKDLMGYGYVFLLPRGLYKNYISGWESGLEEGDICIYYPSKFGDRRTVLMGKEFWEGDSKVLSKIMDDVQEYSKRKDIGYGDVKFVNELQSSELEKMILSNREVEELQEALINKEKDCSKRLEKEFGRERDKCNQEIIRLEKEIEKLTDEKAKLVNSRAREENSKEELEKLKDENRNYKEENEMLRHEMHRLSAPKKPQDIPSWVEEHFSKTLIFHSKAISLIEDVKESEVDMEILCDAITYLATEYWEQLTGKITEAEMNSRCSKRYGRPFLVTPIKGGTIENYPMEYKIKYYKVGNKLRESPLDLHLKVGNDSENLLRIYFLYDKENKLIVVGSLPKHLKTLSMK